MDVRWDGKAAEEDRQWLPVDFSQKPVTVDQLLAKYMRLVLDCEGSDFVDMVDGPGVAVTFTDDEKLTLEAAAQMIRNDHALRLLGAD